MTAAAAADCRVSTPASPNCSRSPVSAMSERLEALVSSLLYEGYALYPYTPGATKNATPTPFGIVYPPVYAETLSSTFDYLELRCAVQAPPDAVLRAEVRMLVAGGERHKAAARRLDLAGAMVGALAAQPAEKEARIEPEQGAPLTVWMRLSATAVEDGVFEVSLRIENRTLVSSGLDRAGALARSLLSTHPILRVTGGGLLSPPARRAGGGGTLPP